MAAMLGIATTQRLSRNVRPAEEPGRRCRLGTKGGPADLGGGAARSGGYGGPWWARPSARTVRLRDEPMPPTGWRPARLSFRIVSWWCCSGPRQLHRGVRGVRKVWGSFLLTCRIAVRAVGAWPGPDARGGEMAATAASNGRFRHLALFYHGRGEYLAALCAFIQAARARGEAVLVAVPERKTQLMRQEVGEDSA